MAYDAQFVFEIPLGKKGPATLILAAAAPPVFLVLVHNVHIPPASPTTRHFPDIYHHLKW